MTKKGLLSFLLIGACVFSNVSVGYATTIDFESESSVETTATEVKTTATTATTATPITTQATTKTTGDSGALIPDSDIVDTDKVENNVKSLSALMGGVTVDEEVAADVNKKMEPIAHIVKYIIGFGLAIVSLGMLVYTVADFLYINLPILRGTLVEAKLVSDEAKMVITPDEMAAQRGRPSYGSYGGGNYGSYGGGSYGSYDDYGSAGGIEGKKSSKPETPNTQYFKLRSKTLVMFAICSVLCLSTLFTQLGLWLGTCVLRIFTFFF